MSKKWIILIAVIAVLGLGAIAVIVLWLFVNPAGTPVDLSLPVYQTEQIPSTHPGYRRTTLTSSDMVFVNDYEEYALQLINPEPQRAVGRRVFGGATVYAIPGQSPTAYVAVDVGSEMPAYEVFRHRQQPPFDWRTANFQRLQVYGGNNRESTDPALIADVVQTLRDGTPTALPSVVATNIQAVHLFSEQLPGIQYSPSLYMDRSGKVYLSASIAMEFSRTSTIVYAEWIEARPLFTKWLQAR